MSKEDKEENIKIEKTEKKIVELDDKLERQVLLTKQNIQVQLITNSRDEDMDYLTKKAMEIFDKYGTSDSYEVS